MKRLVFAAAVLSLTAGSAFAADGDLASFVPVPPGSMVNVSPSQMASNSADTMWVVHTQTMTPGQAQAQYQMSMRRSEAAGRESVGN